MRKVELQGVAFTKHIERSGTGYHLKGYDALQRGRIESSTSRSSSTTRARAWSTEDGTLVVDTRLRDVLRALSVETPTRKFALPGERSQHLEFPPPTDDAVYAAEAAVLDEAYTVRAQRQLDGLEERLEELEHRE
jgi:hypothetical protein